MTVGAKAEGLSESADNIENKKLNPLGKKIYRYTFSMEIDGKQ
jgi:hypothetical protein